jgi:hypothetical protein
MTAVAPRTGARIETAMGPGALDGRAGRPPSHPSSRRVAGVDAWRDEPRGAAIRPGASRPEVLPRALS